ASSMALDTFRRVIAENRARIEASRIDPSSRDGRRDVLSLLEEAAQTACAAVHDEGQKDERKRGMGTTLCALMVVGSHGFIAHVGDSRIYLVRGDRTHQLTQDHTLQNELLKRGRLTPEEISR